MRWSRWWRPRLKITIAPPSHSRLTDEHGSDGALGGIETACLELGDALVARGHEVTILGEPAVHRKARPLGWTRLGESHGDALISCNDARLLSAGRFKARIFWSHNPLAVEKAFRKKQFGPIWSARPPAVFGSRDALEAISPLLRFRSRTVIPLGVTALFESTRTDLPGKPHFAFVSQSQRGLPGVCRVWADKVHPAAPAARLHVFGSSPESARITAEAAAAVGILFYPRADKQALARFYETAMALICVGAADETFCLAAAEAQCAGLPVLTLGIGALGERVSHGVNGLRSDSFEAMAGDAVRLCHDPELSLFLREGALRTRGQFSWARSAKLWEALLVGIL